MNTLAERIAWAFDRAPGATKTGLAKAAGVTPPSVSDWFSGKTKTLRGEPAAGAALYLGVEVQWLTTGRGPKVRGDANVDRMPPPRGSVPLISWVAAGAWNGAADPFEPGDAERWLDCPVNHSERTYALRVRGDSMTAPHGRSYPEGCVVFVDPLKRSPTNGARIIAKLDGSDEVTFKVFRDEDGRKWLQPLNPQYPPIHDPFRVLGTVIGKWEDE